MRDVIYERPLTSWDLFFQERKEWTSQSSLHHRKRGNVQRPRSRWSTRPPSGRGDVEQPDQLRQQQVQV